MDFKKSLIFSVALTSGIFAHNPIEVTDKNFQEVVLKAEKPVIVDFWADWCAPCKAIKPVFAQLAEEFKDLYLFVTVNIDQAQETAQTYKIASIPTFMIFKAGVVHGNFVGGLKAENFSTEVKKALEADPKNTPIAPTMPQDMLLLQAVSQGNKQQVKDLVDSGFDVNHIFKTPANIGGAMVEVEFTSLALSLATYNKEMSQFLLDLGADLDKKFKCQNGTMVTAQELLQFNRDEAVKKSNEMIAFLDEFKERSKK